MTPVTLIGLGEELRARREQQRLELSAVSQETRIARRFLQALEEEKWEEFPAKVYLEGFLKKYANYLDLDGDDFVRRLRERSTDGQKLAIVRPAGHPEDEPREMSASYRYGVALTIVLVLAAAGIYLYMARQGGLGPSESAATRASAPAAAGPAETASHRMQVRATDPVWMRTWVDGQVRFEGILQRGAQRSWNGEAAFRLQVANPQLVEVEVDGAPVKAAPGTSEIVWQAASAAPAGETPAEPAAASPSQTRPVRPARSGPAAPRTGVTTIPGTEPAATAAPGEESPTRPRTRTRAQPPFANPLSLEPAAPRPRDGEAGARPSPEAPAQ